MSVKVRRERPDQRRHHRVTAPMYLRVGEDGPAMRARDWSLGGLRVDDYPADLPKTGASVELSLTLPFQGFDISFSVKARVVRTVPAMRSFAVEFTEIGEREQALMKHFIEDLVRGSMSEVEESIQRIDVPITPVSTQPEVEAKNVVKSRHVPVRQIAWVAIYALIGFLVFGYSGLVLYSNIFRMEVQTAVVAAPLVEVRAQGEGQLSIIRASVGQEVSKGETVIYFADYDLEKQIDLARLEISRREAELSHLVQQRVSEQDRMNQYASVGLKNIEQTKFDLEALEAEHEVAQARRNRMKKLLDKGYATRNQIEDANRFLVAARSKLESKRVELKEQIRLARTGLTRRFFNGNELLGKVDEFDAAIQLARYQLSLSHQSHEALLKHRERLAIRAPFDGIIKDLPQPETASVKRGDLIAVFERRHERKVLAYLTQDEVMKVGLGDAASVYFPSLDTSLRARVITVDRTKGFQEEIGRRYSWRGAEDRSAEVALAFEESQEPAARAQAVPGLPAVVLFESRATNPILAAMWRKVAALFL